MSKLLSQWNLTADGGGIYKAANDTQRDYTVFLHGDFGGGNVTILATPDPVSDVAQVLTDVGIAPITAAEVLTLSIEAYSIRFILAGATAPDLWISLRN